MNVRTCTFLALFLGVFVIFGCEPQPGPTTETEPDTSMTETEVPAPRTATAVLMPTEGNEAAGSVSFLETDEGILVEAALTGLPEGTHGFHVHENGDCSNNAEAAGGHFNPASTDHGAPDSTARHVGDLGNIEANAEGNATYNRVDTHIAFEGTNNILGKAVIVHADADDLSSQPSGAAGARIACGIITEDGL